MEKKARQSIGGKRRAEKLTKEERSSIASVAAKARWAVESTYPKATHPGEIVIGDISIPCAVLENGKRVITEHGITKALGSRSGASKRLKRAAKSDGAPLPVFLAPSQLKPFIGSALYDGPLKPIFFRNKKRVVIGYDAEILPLICDIWLKAREACVLLKQQLLKAQKAEILMRGLAHIGIVALIDEATGYQAERDRYELHKILAAYLSEERLRWAKRFPDEFYKQIYRLKNWPWPNSGKRTPIIGKITNKIVYEKLPKGVLDELRLRNPTMVGAGKRKWKHHQFLSEDIGQPDLRDHLLQLVAIMRISSDWRTFEKHIKVAFPQPGDQLDIPFDGRATP